MYIIYAIWIESDFITNINNIIIIDYRVYNKYYLNSSFKMVLMAHECFENYESDWKWSFG